MNEMIKLSVICIVICLGAAVIDEGSRVMSLMFSAAAAICVLTYTADMLSMLADKVEGIMAVSGIESELFMPLVKVMGIAVCGRISAELCRDLGSRWAAGNIEIISVLLSVVTMLPLISRVIELIDSI